MTLTDEEIKQAYNEYFKDIVPSGRPRFYWPFIEYLLVKQEITTLSEVKNDCTRAKNEDTTV